MVLDAGIVIAGIIFWR